MEAVFQGLGLLITTPIVFVAMAGVGWGILGGALPGISPSIAMALLLPLTYGMDPGLAIVLLASTYVGAEYGGSIPAILINTPGTNAAAATVLDTRRSSAPPSTMVLVRHTQLRPVSGSAQATVPVAPT